MFFKTQIIHKMTGEHESEKIILLELCSVSKFLHKQWYPTVILNSYEMAHENEISLTKFV